MKYNGTVYAGSGDEVALTFTHNYVGCTVKEYRIYEGDAEIDTTNGYVLTMGSTNVVFGFSMTGPSVAQFEQDGTQADSFIISKASD